MPTFENYQVMIVDDELMRIFFNLPETTRMAGKIMVTGGRPLQPKKVIDAESLDWIKDNLLAITEEHCDDNHQDIVIVKRTWGCKRCSGLCTHRDQSITFGRAIFTNASRVRQQFA